MSAPKRSKKQPPAETPEETSGADVIEVSPEIEPPAADAVVTDDEGDEAVADESEGMTDASPAAIEVTAEATPEEAGEGKESKESPAKRIKTPRVTNPAEAKAILECLLFASVEPLTTQQIRDIIRPLKEDDLRTMIVELQNEYDRRGSGLQIVEVAGGYQLATRARYADWLAPFQKRKRRAGLSVAMLETLAIVAYKQPIIRAEVDAIRGVDSSGTMHVLQELDLVEVVGQKQVPGRPNLYGTTKAFLKHFGLKSLSDLPSIESLRERFDLREG